MRLHNGKVIVRVPSLLEFPKETSLADLRELAEKIGCVLKDSGKGLQFVPRNESLRPAADMAPVISIASFQRKERAETFFDKWKRFTVPDHEPTPPSAA